MAALTTQQRAEVAAEYQRDISAAREPVGTLTKADIRAAVDALDAMFVASETSINNTFPVATRNGLTTAQKARLLNAVVRRRYIAGA